MKITNLTTAYIPRTTKTISLCSMPLTKGIAVDCVNFGSANVDKEDAYNLRNIPNLTCACCGKKMINESEFTTLKAKDYEGSAMQVLKKLQKYEKLMRPTEKTVFHLLKRSAAKDPDADLHKLIEKRFLYHLSRLEIKQLKTIEKAVSLRLNLNEESKEELSHTLDNVKKIIFVESKKVHQKRTRIIAEFEDLKKRCKEKQKIDKMLQVIYTLPDSKNDVDSFMTKYNDKERHNKEIGQRLIAPSMPTLDHIKPASKSGHDDFANMLVMCEKCNSSRGSIPYQEWFKIHPEMPENIQKNMNKIIAEINEGRLKYFDDYPQNIKRTLKGVYDLNISAQIIKPPTPEELY